MVGGGWRVEHSGFVGLVVTGAAHRHPDKARLVPTHIMHGYVGAHVPARALYMYMDTVIRLVDAC